MYARRTFFCLAIFFMSVHSPLRAQDQDEFDKMLGATSIKSAEVKTAINKFKRDIRDLNSKFANAFDQHRAALAEKLEEARVDATKADKLDTAIQIRDLLTGLTNLNAAPRESKTTERRSDQNKNNVIRDLVGNWKGNWGTTGAACLLGIDEVGNVMNGNERLQLALRNGRLLAIGASKHQNLEIVPSGERIIVLGWTASKRKNPLTDQPDHVAILSRIGGRTKR